jgi:hypothetical protein
MMTYTDEQVRDIIANPLDNVYSGKVSDCLISILADRTRLQAALDAVDKVAIDLETDAEIVQARNQKLSNTLKSCAKEIRRAIYSIRAEKGDV